MRDVIDKRQKKMLEEIAAKEAEMNGDDNLPPTADNINMDRAMEVITSEMSQGEKEELDSQINQERDEAEKIFTEDDLAFENYDNLMDRKLPVDQELVDKYRKKMGILEKKTMPSKTKEGIVMNKNYDGIVSSSIPDQPKSMNEFQDVIKNNQGAVKRQKKDETQIDHSNDKRE